MLESNVYKTAPLGALIRVPNRRAPNSVLLSQPGYYSKEVYRQW